MKKYIRIAGFAAVIAILTACGGSVKLADGSYEGTSSVYTNPDGSDAGNGYGVVKITVKDNAITECTFKTYEPDGKEKDSEYGKKQGSVANRDFYNKAQKAVKACDEYANKLMQSGNPDDIDAISGATINHGQFVEAAKIALKEAEVK
ncbi:MAG: FMN-binding protein [Catonella sp.]|uniref:FMN-binding protein n=1 Tax=Catonella sp. TaxID=2382125 RepID=UPI003FA01A0E